MVRSKMTGDCSYVRLRLQCAMLQLACSDCRCYCTKRWTIIWLNPPLIFSRAVNWDDPDRRLEWYHSSSSIMQAGPCVRSNQLDFDEEVMYKSTRYLYAAARRPVSARPFCLTVSLTHPHDPYTIHKQYWDRYEGVDIPHPEVEIAKEKQDPHSKRLLRVCDLERDLPDEAIARARRAYFGAVSYVDDNVGKLLEVLKECGMDEDTIVIFSSDHGDMLGERGLWYVFSMPYLEAQHFRHVRDAQLLIMSSNSGTKCHGSRPLLAFHFLYPTLSLSNLRS